MPEASEATVVQALTAVGSGFARDRDDELEIRQWAWWTLNHPIRRRPKIPRDREMETLASANLAALLELLHGSDDEVTLLRAEALRELGRSQACLEELAAVTSGALAVAAARIRDAALTGSTDVLLLQGQSSLDDD